MPQPLDVAPCVAALTPRERQVAAHVARGFSNRNIAAILGTSPNTVHNQVAAIFTKLGVGNRTALAWLLLGGG